LAAFSPAAFQTKPEKDKDAKEVKDKDAKDKDKPEKKEEPVKKGLLEGDWTVKTAEENGAAQKEFDKAVFTFTADKLSAKLDKDVLEYAYKLDESKTPKTIDLWDTPDRKSEPALGIVEVNGDTLKLCIASYELKERPKEFKADKGKVWLFVLERKKAG
jgi:uncharacterized protein (TIGR03067 family)